MLHFVHRVNTIHRVYDYFFNWNIKSIEIDVQTTKDGVLVVHHDDVSGHHLYELPYYVPTFEDFLRYIPENMTINVEIKKYAKSKNDVVHILFICRDYPEHKYHFSSFDFDTYYALKEMCDSFWHLSKDMDSYRPDVEHVCVHKSMLAFINPKKHKTIGAYDVMAGSEANELATLYPFVNVWILDQKTS